LDKWRDVTRRMLACFLGAAVLAACTPGGGAVVTETPSATASGSVTATASPSPSPSASVDVLAQLPEDAKSPGLDGAIATAEFFLTLYAPMFQSGDTALWDALSGPECVYCSDASENAQKVSEGKWAATGGEITPDGATSRARQDGIDAAIVSLEADFADAYLAKDGSTPELQEAAARDKVYVRLILSDGVWLVDGVMIGEQ
jgi:hypothetical protein